MGFREERIQLMAYEDVDEIGAGSFVRNTKKRLKIPVGEFLRGRVINALGKLHGRRTSLSYLQFYYVENPDINPLSRPPIDEVLEFGVKAIDGLNTIGKGQRIGIFAGSGVGKSTLLGMIARNVTADINVIALVGGRRRQRGKGIYRERLGTGGYEAFYPDRGHFRSASHASHEMPV